VEVNLYTLDGKQVWHQTIATDMLSATALEAPATPGMYLLKLTAGNQVITETIVVSNTKN
jgi:hypothetical protein